MAISDWVHDQARKANRNLLLVNGIILALLLCFVAVQGRYFYNFILGSQKIEPAELVRPTSPSQRSRNFVTVQGEKSVLTGYQEVVRKINKATRQVVSTEVKAEYAFLKVQDKLLLVKARPGAARLEYSGALTPVPADFQQDYLKSLLAERPQLAGRILPFELDATEYLNTGITFLILGLPLGALAIWNCGKALRRSSNEATLPGLATLAAYGNVDQLSMEIETERKLQKERYGDLEVTQSWIMRRSLFSLWLCPVHDLAWAYKKVTKHSVYFIPTGKTFAVILAGGRRQRVEVNMPEPLANQLLTTLAARAPWAIFGFSADIEKAWRKKTQAFLDMVAERKRKYAGPA